MKKIVIILICIIFAQHADAKIMTLQQVQEKARAQMDAVQKYVQEKMDGMKIASQSAYEKIVADAAAAQQSTEAFIKAHKKELIAAGLIVGTVATVAVGAKIAESAQKNQRQREGYEADVQRGVDLFLRLSDPEQEALAKRLLGQLKSEQEDVYREAIRRLQATLGQQKASELIMKAY